MEQQAWQENTSSKEKSIPDCYSWCCRRLGSAAAKPGAIFIGFKRFLLESNLVEQATGISRTRIPYQTR
jgi:hypothetical protein